MVLPRRLGVANHRNDDIDGYGQGVRWNGNDALTRALQTMHS